MSTFGITEEFAFSYCVWAHLGQKARYLTEKPASTGNVTPVMYRPARPQR
jgi:hypothetical protein